MSNNNALWQRWVGGEWGECSVTCGEGEQTREILCRQEITPTLTMTVAEGACLTPPSPLLQRTRSCQRLPCPGPGSGGQWSVGAWSQVSAGPICTYLNISSSYSICVKLYKNQYSLNDLRKYCYKWLLRDPTRPTKMISQQTIPTGLSPKVAKKKKM